MSLLVYGVFFTFFGQYSREEYTRRRKEKKKREQERHTEKPYRSDLKPDM